MKLLKKACSIKIQSIFDNVIIGLIHVANYLLDRQILGLESDFVKEGVGLRKRMTKAKLVARNLPTKPVA